LKPENIFLQRSEFVKILDFGIAKFIERPDSMQTATGAVFGTPHTMSPEQCRGLELDLRSDIYSLGVVAFFMLSGEYPFKGSPAEVMSGHILLSRPPLGRVAPQVPDALAAVVGRALAKSPAQRFASMDELVQVLRSPEQPETLPETSEYTPRRKKLPLLIAAVAGALGVAWILMQKEVPP